MIALFHPGIGRGRKEINLVGVKDVPLPGVGREKIKEDSGTNENVSWVSKGLIVSLKMTSDLSGVDA